MTTFPLCKLCKKRPANKSGSHVLPFSLISTSITENASGKRDKEIMYQLKPSKTYKYIARGVLPEGIEKESLITSNIEKVDNNLATVDYDFCTTCENRFGNIEEYFSSNVIKKLKKTVSVDSEKTENVQIFNIDARLIYLYVYLLFWRCSVTNIYSINLNKEFEENLRVILDNYLEEGNIKTVINKLNKNTLFSINPFLCFYFFEREDDTVNTIVGTEYDSGSQLIIANRFGFLLKSYEGFEGDQIFNDFYSINKLLGEYLYNNEVTSNFQILRLDKTTTDVIHECIVEEYVREYIDVHTDDFINFYKSVTQENPLKEVVSFYINSLCLLGVNVHPKQIDDLKQSVLRRFSR